MTRTEIQGIHFPHNNRDGLETLRFSPFNQLTRLLAREICTDSVITTTNINTTSACFVPFFFNTLCQFISLFDQRTLIFDFTHVRWLRTGMLSGEYESHGEEQKWKAKRSLLEFVTVRLPFSTDHVGYLHFFQFFVLSTNATITQSIEDQKKTYTKMNNYSINFNGSNMYDLWVIN